MIKHTHSENSEINFSKLEDRLISISNPDINKANKFRELLYELLVINKPTLIMATGGSKVIAYYLQNILERMGLDGLISEVIEPRDYFYKMNKNNFSNLLAISASGHTNGIKEALNDFNGNKYLICEKEKEADYEVITWGNDLYDREKSFISLATSLGPMALLLSATSFLEKNITSKEVIKINDKIKKLLELSARKIDKLDKNFIDTNLIQVMSGYDTKCSSIVLESNLVESGACSVVIHDKGSYCHGRSNLLFQNPESSMIYLSHVETELDKTLIDSIRSEYSNICIFDSQDIDDNYFWKEYYLMLQMYYLSKRIADDKNIDLTMPEYNENVIRKLYKFKGEM